MATQKEKEIHKLETLETKPAKPTLQHNENNTNVHVFDKIASHYGQGRHQIGGMMK